MSTVTFRHIKHDIALDGETRLLFDPITLVADENFVNAFAGVRFYVREPVSYICINQPLRTMAHGGCGWMDGILSRPVMNRRKKDTVK
jgi:hypothetical protein